jgi:hypothetical protein
MGEYIQVERRLERLTRRGLAMIGMTVAVAGFVDAIGAPEARAEQSQMSQKAQPVRSPVSRLKPGEGIDFANAIPMALPEKQPPSGFAD